MFPENENDRVPVTVLGLGMMGSALASVYLKAGHPTTVWNRTADRAAPLVAAGATAAGDVTQAVSAGDLIIICVTDHDAMRSTLEPVAAALTGKAIVNLTSGVPADARSAAQWAASAGARYLDGYVMTVPPAVGLPQTLLFYGGSREVFEQYEDTLKALGGTGVFVGEDPGIAALYDLALLGMLWSALAGALHGFAMLAGEGIPAAALAPFAENWLTHLVQPSIAGAAQQVDAGQYATTISTVGLNAAGLDAMVEASRAQGIRPDLMVPIRDMMRRRADDGHGADALASMIEVIKQG